MAAKKRKAVKMTDTQKQALFTQLAGLLDNKGTFEPPEYDRQRDDVLGYWVPEAGVPIHGECLGVKVFDNATEPQKVSGLLFFKLIDPCPVVSTGADGKPILAEAGETVGVWAKPGMRVLKKAQGQPVWMRLEAEEHWKDTGKQNLMKTFEIYFPERRDTLLVFEDTREESAALETWLVTPLPVQDPYAGPAPRSEGKKEPVDADFEDEAEAAHKDGAL